MENTNELVMAVIACTKEHPQSLRFDDDVPDIGNLNQAVIVDKSCVNCKAVGICSDFTRNRYVYKLSILSALNKGVKYNSEHFCDWCGFYLSEKGDGNYTCKGCGRTVKIYDTEQICLKQAPGYKAPPSIAAMMTQVMTSQAQTTTPAVSPTQHIKACPNIFAGETEPTNVKEELPEKLPEKKPGTDTATATTTTTTTVPGTPSTPGAQNVAIAASAVADAGITGIAGIDIDIGNIAPVNVVQAVTPVTPSTHVASPVPVQAAKPARPLTGVKSHKKGTGEEQFQKIIAALKDNPLTYNELLDAVPEFKEYSKPLNSLRPVILRYGMVPGKEIIEYTQDRPLKLRLKNKDKVAT